MSDTGQISDGYHTFNELYAHRIALWKALCKQVSSDLSGRFVWRARAHFDGTTFDGWFVLGMGHDPGEQITYHLPDSEWDNCDFAQTFERAPCCFDGHTAADVLHRLSQLNYPTSASPPPR